MSRADRITVTDESIGEIVARQGGYEMIERDGALTWEKIANSLGLSKTLGPQVKARYEDMLRTSAQQDEHEDEDEDEEYEVEDILDSRTDDKGNVEYLVKWKEAGDDGDGDGGDDDDNTTWEPRENLACPDLLKKFEEGREKLARAPEAVQDGDDLEDAGASMAEAEAINGKETAKRKLDTCAPLAGTDAATSAPSSSSIDGGSGNAYQRVVRVRPPNEKQVQGRPCPHQHGLSLHRHHRQPTPPPVPRRVTCPLTHAACPIYGV